MKSLGITPSFHINHLYYYGEALRADILGATRTEALLPIHSTEEKGIPFTLHADQPMFESDPFRLIQTAVERKTTAGVEIGSDEKIALYTAIRSLTLDAAWQIGMEAHIGSLETGKYADFIVLDRDPFATPLEELQDIDCVQVFVAGNMVQ